MGLNDNVNSLKNEIKNSNEQRQRELKEAERKQLIKYELLDILKSEILEAQEQGQDIFNTYAQAEIVNNTINEPTIEYLINKDFTRYWLLENYNKIVKDIQKEIEKEKKEEKQKQKEIEKEMKEEEKHARELEKEYIKQQKELKKELEAERIRKAEARKTIIEAIKLLCLIILSPFLLIIFFMIAIMNNKNLGK